VDAGYPRGSKIWMEKLYPAMKNIWEAMPTARNRIDWDMSFRDLHVCDFNVVICRYICMSLAKD